MAEQFIIKTSLGNITLSLYDDTPLHRDNFMKMVAEKYYDGIRFHRVINGFMVQTGDPLSRHDDKRTLHGTGGPSHKVPAEILHPNKKEHLPQRATTTQKKHHRAASFTSTTPTTAFLTATIRCSAW